MSSTAWLLSAGFGVLMLLGVPFAFAIGIVVALSLLVSGIEPMLLPQAGHFVQEHGQSIAEAAVQLFKVPNS